MKNPLQKIKSSMAKALLLLGFNLAFASQSIAQTKLPLDSSMGSFNGVTAYSNESSSRESTVYNYQYESSTGTNYNLGFKWQCVEYCNRYYFQVYRKKIRIAGTNAVDYFGTASSRGLVSYANGGTEPPKPGDILCFKGGTGGYGHVSICRFVSSTAVNVCQQNVTCTTRDSNFAHSMAVKSGKYTVSGASLGKTYVCQGWLRVPGNKPVASVISSPSNGSKLTNERQTFAWNAVNGASEYWIHLGTTTGDYDLYGGSMGTNTSVTFEGLPTDGSKLYVRLFSKVSTGWIFSDSIFTCYAPSIVQSKPGEIYFPGNGDTLVGPEPLFQWNPAPGALEYFFYMGNSPGANDIYGQSNGLRTYVNLIGVPRDGRLLYVRLWIRTAASWTYKDYAYRARNW